MLRCCAVNGTRGCWQGRQRQGAAGCSGRHSDARATHLWLGRLVILLLLLPALQRRCHRLPAATQRPTHSSRHKVRRALACRPAAAAAGGAPGPLPAARRAVPAQDHAFTHLSAFIVAFRCLALSFLRCAAVSLGPPFACCPPAAAAASCCGDMAAGALAGGDGRALGRRRRSRGPVACVIGLAALPEHTALLLGRLQARLRRAWDRPAHAQTCRDASHAAGIPRRLCKGACDGGKRCSEPGRGQLTGSSAKPCGAHRSGLPALAAPAWRRSSPIKRASIK